MENQYNQIAFSFLTKKKNNSKFADFFDIRSFIVIALIK